MNEVLKLRCCGRQKASRGTVMVGEVVGILRNVSLVIGLLASASFAAQGTSTDAQVEANVLKALAAAPELANQPIQTRTVYGTVTLSGSVQNEALRRRAETLASTAEGVKKVVDELALAQNNVSQSGTPNPQISGNQPANDQPGKLVLQSDGTYAPAETSSPADQQPTATVNGAVPVPQRNNPDADQALDRQMEQQANGNGQTAGQYPGPNTGYPGAPEYPAQPAQPQYPAQPRYPAQSGQPQYSAQPSQPQYPYSQNVPRPMNPSYAQNGPGSYAPPYPDQTGGQVVTIPSGALMQVRINQPLSSSTTKPGQVFNGIVVNDIIAGNAIAIPRGAAVQGKVLDVEKAGVIKGRGELGLQLTQVTLGGKTYPVVSDLWDHHGGDKTLQSINSTAVGGGLGALVGAAAGGGVGAAIGAGVGGAVGLGSSAASGGGQVYLPAEALLTFHLVEPATVTTVGQQEMQRLAYGLPAGVQPGYYPRRRLSPYPYYYGPAYYRPYGPYPYPY